MLWIMSMPGCMWTAGGWGVGWGGVGWGKRRGQEREGGRAGGGSLDSPVDAGLYVNSKWERGDGGERGRGWMGGGLCAFADVQDNVNAGAVCGRQVGEGGMGRYGWGKRSRRRGGRGRQEEGGRGWTMVLCSV